MRLLLDEMISPRIALALRDLGWDVHAIKKDRADLQAQADADIVRLMKAELRVIVTNNVNDFMPIHNLLLRQGDSHAGMIFTFDSTMPRNKDSNPTWIKGMDALLREHPSDNAMVNRILHLP